MQGGFVSGFMNCIATLLRQHSAILFVFLKEMHFFSPNFRKRHPGLYSSKHFLLKRRRKMSVFCVYDIFFFFLSPASHCLPSSPLLFASVSVAGAAVFPPQGSLKLYNFTQWPTQIVVRNTLKTNCCILHFLGSFFLFIYCNPFPLFQQIV